LIICDTSGLYSAYISSQPQHARSQAALDTEAGLLVMSTHVLTELDYLLRTRAGVDAETAMLGDVASDAYEIASLSSDELRQAISLINQYSNRNLGIADAANVLDERDYRIVRPLWGKAFRILPFDS
jgi:predicted nucleic acid-binding protein